MLEGKLWTYLADLNEQAQDRLQLIIRQMQEAESVNDELKENNQMAWIQAMNSIHNRAEKNRPSRIGIRGGCVMRILEEFWYGNVEPMEYGSFPMRSTKNYFD